MRKYFHYTSDKRKKWFFSENFPSLIIVDSPFANNDIQSQRNIISLLKIVKFHECSVIITTTEGNDLHGSIDNILILKKIQMKRNKRSSRVT